MGNHEESAKHASTKDAFRGPTLSADYGQWRQLKLDEPRVMAAGECSLRNRGQEVDLVWTNYGSWTRVEAVRGIRRIWSADVDCGRAWSAETRKRGRVFMWTNREPRPWVGAVRGRYQDHLTHLPFGSNPGLLGRPVRVLSYYKYILDLILELILFSI